MAEQIGSFGMNTIPSSEDDAQEDQMDDINRLKIIHVAGTKGKGSTCAYIECLLRSHGLKTGLYTGPHLISPEERIRINFLPLQQDVFAQCYAVRGCVILLQSLFTRVPLELCFCGSRCRACAHVTYRDASGTDTCLCTAMCRVALCCIMHITTARVLHRVVVCWMLPSSHRRRPSFLSAGESATPSRTERPQRQDTVRNAVKLTSPWVRAVSTQMLSRQLHVKSGYSSRLASSWTSPRRVQSKESAASHTRRPLLAHVQHWCDCD